MNGTIKYVPTSFAAPLAGALAEPPVAINVYDADARVRVKRFSVTATAAIAQNAVVALCLIAKNARIIGGAIKHSAYSTGRTLDIGLVGADASGYIAPAVADDVDFFLDGIDVSNAGADTFADMAAGDANALYLTQKDVLLVATILGGTIPLNGTLEGYILYVVD